MAIMEMTEGPEFVNRAIASASNNWAPELTTLVRSGLGFLLRTIDSFPIPIQIALSWAQRPWRSISSSIDNIEAIKAYQLPKLAQV